MLHGRLVACCAFLAVSFIASSADAQSVISTRSGVIHYFEGAVYLGDQPLESHLGKFSSVPQGGELRTEKGRAEVLLTPGVFLWMGERTTIRMVANQLSDTRVELLGGSAILDSAGPTAGASVTLLYKNWSMQFSEEGFYRIDSDPPVLRVVRGKAEVSAGSKGDSVLVSHGTSMPFAQVLVPALSTDRSQDALSTWAEGRQQSISADNAIAANIQDPAGLAVVNSGVDSFTYFPMLGLSSVWAGASGPYSAGIYQPGFNSIYLPGYHYLPNYTYLLLLPATIHSGVYSMPSVPTYAGGLPIVAPHSGIGSPMPVRPFPIVPRPVPVQPTTPHPAPVSPVSPHPIPIHPASPAGTHSAVVHR
jgi:hypothetical protein